MCLGAILFSKIKVTSPHYSNFPLTTCFSSCIKLVTILILLTLVQRVVYGAKAEVGVASGFGNNIADAVKDTGSFYEKVNLEIKKAEGSVAVIAEQVFEKTKDKFVVP